MPRVLIVANRLPVTVSPTNDGVEVQKSPGGLATGLLRSHEQSGGLWIGWPGTLDNELSPSQRSELNQKLTEMRLIGVPLTGDQVARYYEGFSNGVLWPLFHYLLDQIPLHVRNWDSYA
ncbi:MAG TPA: trehalose-6-phosphate synthase, partial [Gemmatimonadales bacterium]|nr:trehalose-6-phosphate synthase [Gemmatimonadales bacterium]